MRVALKGIFLVGHFTVINLSEKNIKLHIVTDIKALPYRQSDIPLLFQKTTRLVTDLKKQKGNMNSVRWQPKRGNHRNEKVRVCTPRSKPTHCRRKPPFLEPASTWTTKTYENQKDWGQNPEQSGRRTEKKNHQTEEEHAGLQMIALTSLCRSSQKHRGRTTQNPTHQTIPRDDTKSGTVVRARYI